MKLNNSTENWSALLRASAALPDADQQFLDEWGEELRARALFRLEERGIDYDTVYYQRVGAFEIVQSANPDERKAFCDVLDIVLPEVVRDAQEDWEYTQEQLRGQD